MAANPQPQTGRLARVPLPVGGLNVRDAYEVMPPTDAVVLTNMLSGTYGLSTRKGYQEWATDLPGLSNVGTIMSFYPSVAAPSGVNNGFASSMAQNSMQLPFAQKLANVAVGGKIFACTSKQIYDITAGGTGPWTPQAGLGVVDSDYWIWRNFQNAAGSFLVACNDEGAYCVYGGAGFSDGFSDGFRIEASGFARIAEGEGFGNINGVNPDLFCYVMSWKRRLWFVEKDSTRAWYLPPEQLTGEVFQFDFGPMFRAGGHLVALANWTIDGGEGIDDYLVAFGSEGDVVIYKGYDPDSADVDPNAFMLHGIWYVGPLPAGRRQVDPYGGDVYVLSVQGLNQVSKLVPMSSLEPESIRRMSYKIDPLLNDLVQRTSEDKGWFLKAIPREQMTMIGSPEVLAGQGVQEFAYAVPTQAWSIFRELPIACITTHANLVFGGTSEFGPDAGGKVFLMFDNTLDGVPLEPTADDAGKLIASSVIPAYSSYGTVGMWHSVPMIRPMIVADVVPSYSVGLLTDFQYPEFRSTIPIPPVGSSLWDQALWDQGKWTGSPRPIRKWVAVQGGGYACTCQIDMTSTGNTKLPAIDAWLQDGGPL